MSCVWPRSHSAAVELFLERLDDPVRDGSLASVDEIAAPVDGLPLALELAAGLPGLTACPRSPPRSAPIIQDDLGNAYDRVGGPFSSYHP